jgi:hypothetical protein
MWGKEGATWAASALTILSSVDVSAWRLTMGFWGGIKAVVSKPFEDTKELFTDPLGFIGGKLTDPLTYIPGAQLGKTFVDGWSGGGEQAAAAESTIDAEYYNTMQYLNEPEAVPALDPALYEPTAPSTYAAAPTAPVTLDPYSGAPVAPADPSLPLVQVKDLTKGWFNG